MQYKINDRILQYETEGNTVRGKAEILLEKAIDLAKKTGWSEKGYSIELLFQEEIYKQFESSTHNLLLNVWKSSGLNIPTNFTLDQYHTLIHEYADHIRAVEKTKFLSVEDFPINIKILEERISEICQERLEVKNPFDNQSIYHFRVIRPNTNDNNPLHRDVWLEDYDDCINLYIPIAGSNEESSLILIPTSHRWKESEIERTESGAVINGVRFNVPAVTAINKEYQAIRGNPNRNEVLVFSPYMIHGGAINLHPDKTRISIEIRLWRKS